MFVFKSLQKIISDQAAYITANTVINDVTPGSVILTMIEMLSQEIYQTYIQMVNIIQTYSLDTTSGTDLDNKGFEFGLVRLASQKASDYVTISDISFTKIATKVFAGTNGAVTGQTTIDVDDTSDFPVSGTIIVGRDTSGEETVDYLSITDHTTYYTINLDPLTPLTQNHKVGETVILSQGGLRTVAAGTVVYVPETNISSQISYTVNENVTLADGEDTETNVLVTATVAGSNGNIPVGAITTFYTLPFAGAQVTNPTSFNNGSDLETDQEFRDRIRNWIQSLSRGTITALKTLTSGLTNTEQTKRVVSSNFVESIISTDPSYLYIDDGTGFEPTSNGQAVEYVVRDAAGTEQLIQLDNFPVVKAMLVANTDQPYNVASGDKLRVSVNDVEEEIVFTSNDFSIVGAATARELAIAINDRMELVEARTINSGTTLTIQPVTNISEKIKIITPLTGTNANDAIQFDEDKYFYTLKLYKNDILLNKDGLTAFVDTANTAPYTLAHAQTLTLYIDNKTTNLLTIVFDSADFVDITQATTEEVADAINKELPGGYAVSILDNSKVRVYSRTEKSSDSYVQIVGGTGNAALAFPVVINAGADEDYRLNRYNGQVKLSTPLTADDIVTAGTNYTEAFLETVSPENYNVGVGETLIFSVDGYANQTYTFAAGSYTASDIATLINEDDSLVGVKMYVITRGSDNYLRIATNTLDGTGTIRVQSTSTAVALDFPTDTTATSEIANIAFIEPVNVSSYTNGPNQNLVLILDDDAVNRVFSLIFSVTGTVTNSISDTTFDSTNIRNNYSGDNDFFNSYLCYFSNTTTTVALRGYMRVVSDYNGTTGNILLSDALPDTPVNGDTFYLVPISASNIMKFLNNTNITPFSIYSDIRLIKNSTKFQIATTTSGSEGAVEVTSGSANSILIPFTTAGSSGGDFQTNSVNGLFYGEADLVLGTTYVGGMKVTLDNILNSYTYDFVSSGTAGGTFEVDTIRRIKINDGIVIKSTTQTTYLNGYVYDVDAVGSIAFASNGTSAGTFTTNSIVGLTVGDPVVIKDSNTASYTNGYIYSIVGAGSPYTITIYDYDTGDVVNLSAYTTAQSAAVYYAPFTVTVYDRTTSAAENLTAFITADTAQASSVYDKGYIQNIVGAVAPYTITIYDEDSRTLVDTLEMYTLDYKASLKDRKGFAFETVKITGVDGYKYYTGLLREVQWKVDGLDSDTINYPGIKAAGVKIEVAPPVVRPIKLSLDISTKGDVTLGSIDSQIKSVISQYVNNLKVGEDVVLGAIEAAVRTISTVYDVQVTSPISNIVISDNELARILATDILLA